MPLILVLDVGVFVADVEIGIAYRGIVGNAGRLKQHFVDRRVLALGKSLDRLLIDDEELAPKFRQKEIVARLVEGVDLALESLRRAGLAAALFDVDLGKRDDAGRVGGAASCAKAA